jgi:hypothetical protein
MLDYVWRLRYGFQSNLTFSIRNCSFTATKMNGDYQIRQSRTLRDVSSVLCAKKYEINAWCEGGACPEIRTKSIYWLRRLVAGLSRLRYGFTSGSVHVGFVVDKVALGLIYLRGLPCKYYSTKAPSTWTTTLSTAPNRARFTWTRRQIPVS